MWPRSSPRADSCGWADDIRFNLERAPAVPKNELPMAELGVRARRSRAMRTGALLLAGGDPTVARGLVINGAGSRASIASANELPQPHRLTTNLPAPTNLECLSSVHRVFVLALFRPSSMNGRCAVGTSNYQIYGWGSSRFTRRSGSDLNDPHLHAEGKSSLNLRRSIQEGPGG